MLDNQNKIPKKHHYLPVFYLKGFTNNKGAFHVYDKIENKIYENSRPENFFYENHLNSFKKEGEVKFTLETKFFSKIDSTAAPLFKKLIAQGSNAFTPIEGFGLLHFLISLFWRLPNHPIQTEIIEKYGFINNYLEAIDKNTGVSLSNERIKILNETMLKDPETIKIIKHTMAFGAGNEELWSLYGKWNTQTMLEGCPGFVIGDNPFLINNPSVKINNIFNELIIPLSSKHLLILSERAPKYYDNLMHFGVNSSILHQSNRFIACNDLAYLTKLVIDYKSAANKGLTKSVIEDTFGHMKKLSKIKSEDEYYKLASLRANC